MNTSVPVAAPKKSKRKASETESKQNGKTPKKIRFVEDFETASSTKQSPKESKSKSLESAPMKVENSSEEQKLDHTKEDLAWSGNDTSQRVTCINLPFDISREDLQELFSEFGKVIDVRLAQRNGSNSGLAFVDFDSTESALKAIEGLNQTQLGGRTIRVEKYRDQTKVVQENGE